MNSPTQTTDNRRPQATDNERREKLQRLVLCREKLSPEDAALLHEIFPDIFKAHYKPVWDYLRNCGLSDYDAKDLLQETFVLLYEHILDEGFPDKLIALLLSMAEGKVANYQRGKRRSLLSFGLPPSSSMKPASGLDIDRAMDLRRLTEEILPLLSPEHRGVIDKLVICGLSYRDAAEVLHIPEGTLRSRLIAAKRILADLVKARLPPSQWGCR